MGIPQSEMVTAGKLCNEIIWNEFVPMLDLGKVASDLSARTVKVFFLYSLYHLQTFIYRNYSGATKGIDEN